MTAVLSPTWMSHSSSRFEGEHSTTSSISLFPVFSLHLWLYLVSLCLRTQEKNFHWVSIVLILDFLTYWNSILQYLYINQNLKKLLILIHQDIYLCVYYHYAFLITTIMCFSKNISPIIYNVRLYSRTSTFMIWTLLSKKNS